MCLIYLCLASANCTLKGAGNAAYLLQSGLWDCTVCGRSLISTIALVCYVTLPASCWRQGHCSVYAGCLTPAVPCCMVVRYTSGVIVSSSETAVHSTGSRTWNSLPDLLHRLSSFAWKGEGKGAYLYSAFYILCISQSAQAWITQFYLQIYHACLSFVCVHQMVAPPLTEVRDI